MADQGRWFKLWCSAPSDDSLQQLTPAHRWAWAVLGCHIKVHGVNGAIEISSKNTSLAAQMGVAMQDMDGVINSFPNVLVNGCLERDGKCTVTWRKWHKYQVDASAERTRKLRVGVTAKKRREEKRRESTPLPPTKGGDIVPIRKPKPDPNIPRVIDAYHDAFLQRFGAKPTIPGRKYGAIARQLLSGGRTVDEAVWIVRQFFSAPPAFYYDRNLWGLEHVVSAANTLLAERSRG